MPSDAFTQLNNRIKDLDQLIQAHGLIGGEARGRRWKLAALNRAALVLATAHLEGYLEDLFKETMEKLLNARVSATRVPDNVKVLGLRRLAGPIMRTSDRKKQTVALLRILKKAKKYGHPAKKISSRDIRGVDYEAELQRFSNPKPEFINDLFWYLGIDDILSKIQWRRAPSRKIWRYLKELVGKRNSIAHGTVGINVKKEEVRYCREFLIRFAQKIERVVGEHLRNVTGHAPW